MVKIAPAHQRTPDICATRNEVKREFYPVHVDLLVENENKIGEQKEEGGKQGGGRRTKLRFIASIRPCLSSRATPIMPYI